MKWVLTSLITLIFSSACIGQTASPPTKTTQKTQPSKTSFVCPDPEAQKACKSYDELVKAKDSGLPDDGFICFRKTEDEFFTIWFSGPYFRKHWDKEQKRMVADEDATSPARGFAHTYKNGVQDFAVVPTLSFKGYMVCIPGLTDV
jgi:hypothetical protein